MCKKEEMQILALLLWGKPVIFSSQNDTTEAWNTQKSKE